MTTQRTARLAALLVLPAALALVGAAAPATAAGEKAYQINLDQLNDSQGKGTALLSLSGNKLTVKIESEGLVPGQPHAQHIHGSTDGHDFQCPDESADTDGDGIINNTEATVHYGDINISLTTDGDTSAESGLAVDRMPKADAQGKLSYERTIPVSQDVVDHIKDLHVVQHGIDPNGNKKYDFGVGKSELDPTLPQEATAPAVCGIVEGAAVGSVPVGGVETGGGTAASDEVPGALVATGALAVVATAGAVLLGRRKRSAAGVEAAGRSAA
ncbi:hypothetical protein FCH28_30120 [Streptomyces piniterrae]|uniref:CHRD domain-containing protein n=1 Tax=Streptomyces piniterrae TaxID=2571125 RepID=A0A4U0MV32_9ACTN|nr:hypothetical protein [Streptomyces piniterrae]TJZ44586.1 hypothetical protein FCH28_30120 [Streptomyces piniterrae]